MNPIHIRLLCGNAAGRTRRFDQPELTFGRGPDNSIVVDAPHASRHHGTLRWTGEAWTLDNASANGSTVNRKRVTDKPVVLKSGDTVGVGGQPLFSVDIDPPPEGGATPQAQAATSPEPQPSRLAPGQGSRDRSNLALWFGIAGSLVGVIFLMFAFVKPLSAPDNHGGPAGEPELSAEQIRTEITRMPDLPLNEREARQHLEEARRHYQRSITQPDSDALYQAYRNFKLAYAKSDGELFAEGLAFREFKRCEEQLVDKVIELHRDGHNQLGANQWDQAEQTFRQLTDIYRDTQSRIFQNATAQLRLAQRRSRG